MTALPVYRSSNPAASHGRPLPMSREDARFWHSRRNGITMEQQAMTNFPDWVIARAELEKRGLEIREKQS